MADDIGLEELKKLKLSDILARQNSQQEKLNNKPKPLGLIEHVDLDQADKERRARMKVHPTHGQTKQIPDRWTSTGTIVKPDR